MSKMMEQLDQASRARIGMPTLSDTPERKSREILRESYIRQGRVQMIVELLKWVSPQEPYGPFEVTLINYLTQRSEEETQAMHTLFA